MVALRAEHIAEQVDDKGRNGDGDIVYRQHDSEGQGGLAAIGDGVGGLVVDDRLEDMIVFAKAKSQRLFLDITTNGRLLTVELVDRLFRLGLDNININDYRGDRDKYPEKWSACLEPIYVAYWNNPKVSFKRRRFDEPLPNYAGNIPQTFSKENLGFCNYPFRKLTIAYNGDVLLCCDDFMYKTSFGNVMTDNLIDCWNNPELNTIRLSLLDNKRIGLCERCNDFQDYNTF